MTITLRCHQFSVCFSAYFCMDRPLRRVQGRDAGAMTSACVLGTACVVCTARVAPILTPSKACHASEPIFSAHPPRDPQGGGDRLAPPDAACRPDSPGGR